MRHLYLISLLSVIFCINNFQRVESRFYDYDWNQNNGPFKRLFELVRDGDLEKVKEEIGNGIDVNIKGAGNWSALHVSAEYGQESIAEFLIKNGANVNATERNNWTPLHNACWNGYEDIVTLLLDHNANIHALQDHNCTPLHLAAQNNQMSVAELLIDRGANINAKNEYGWTPIHDSSYRGYADFVKFLINKGALLDLKNNDGQTPLDVATQQGYTNVVVELLRKELEHPAQGTSIGIPKSLIIILIIILSLMLLTIVMKYFYKRMSRRDQDFNQFLEGDPTRVDPQNQFYWLPYNRAKYEFNEENLKYEKEPLGQGAFGRVDLAKAKNIRSNERETMVAVKTAKAMSIEAFESLRSELKILSNLKSHSNIVNMLGAVTKKGRAHLKVIVEYCPHGSLDNYLKIYRGNFVDQIERNDEGYFINRNIGKLQTANGSSDSLDSGNFSCEAYGSISATKTKTKTNECIEMREINMRAPTTMDLISFIYQIACGMNHLSQQQVLHGDLAARNVLLCDDNLVKICDFGLARSLYKRAVYVKTSDTKLPLAWMSIESIRHNEFSVKSDVWSFGITIWEIFTLGQVPYPGIDLRNLLNYLLAGNRLQKPRYATQNFYNLMDKCWLEDTNRRPSFGELMEDIVQFQQDECCNHSLEAKTSQQQNESTHDISPHCSMETSNYVSYNQLEE